MIPKRTTFPNDAVMPRGAALRGRTVMPEVAP
jgi:hypothetical protein